MTKSPVSATEKPISSVVQVSQRSLDRFLTLIESVTGPFTCIHQTLTFPTPVFELPLAKKALKRLLDAVHKGNELACIYVAEKQTSGGWHFHLLFFLFESQNSPEKVKAELGSRIFRLWNGIHSSKCVRAANRTTVISQVLPDYLVKAVHATSSTKRSDGNWWGCRNRKILKKNSVKKPKKQREKPLNALNQRINSRSNRLHGHKKLAVRRGTPWAEYKRKLIFSERKVTDKEFLDYLEAPSKVLF